MLQSQPEHVQHHRLKYFYLSPQISMLSRQSTSPAPKARAPRGPSSPQSSHSTSLLPRKLRPRTWNLFRPDYRQRLVSILPPHLRFVRERIRINNEPISETLFAKYFFQVWDRLENVARKEGKPPSEITAAKPVYFRFLTLMAFHTYIQEGVDTAVIECGIGGEYDSTNIIVTPTTTGITSLGIDHTSLLGETIEEIAWHKGGIMKEGARVFTAPQPIKAMRVLTQRAEEKRVELKVVDVDSRLQDVRLGLAGDFQQVNASLAIQLAAAHLMALGHTNPIPLSRYPSSSAICQWPGTSTLARKMRGKERGRHQLAH